MARWRCIFCQDEFDEPASKDEHIILKSLGGKSTSRILVCGGESTKDCNNKLGKIEAKLVELPPLWFARAVLGLGRTKNLSAKFKTDDGVDVAIGKDGKLRFAKDILDFNQKKVKPGLKKLSYTVSNEKALEKVEQQLAGKGVVGRKTVTRDVRFWDKKVLSAESDFGTEEEYRAVAKLAFMTLAYGADWIDIQHDSFNNVRQYIYKDDKPDGKEFVWVDRQDIYNLLPVEGDFYNRVTVYFDPSTKLVVGFVEVLKHFTYSVLLSEDYNGPRKAFQLLNRPLDAEERLDQISALPDDFNRIALDDLIKNDREDMRPKLQEAWANLGSSIGSHKVKQGHNPFDDFINRLITAAIKNVGYEGKEYFEAEDYFYIARYVTERVKPFLRVDPEMFELMLLEAFTEMVRDYNS